jgi:hypothetical protein
VRLVKEWLLDGRDGLDGLPIRQVLPGATEDSDSSIVEGLDG